MAHIHLEEAELRCKLLREMDPNHDVASCKQYVDAMGTSYKTGRVEDPKDELNKLMHEKKKNEDSAKEQLINVLKKRVKMLSKTILRRLKKVAINLRRRLMKKVNLLMLPTLLHRKMLLLVKL